MAVQRDANGRVMKGSVLNAGGKVALTEEQKRLHAEAMEILHAATPMAAKALVVMLGGKDGHSAAVTILERTMGKAQAAPEDRAAIERSGLSDAEVLLIARMRKP